MPGEQSVTNKVKYLSVVQGRLAEKVEAGTPGANARAWKSPSGKEGVSHEILFDLWEGVIRNITIADAPYATETRKILLCKIHFDDAVISLTVGHKYFSDFAKRIAGADLTKPLSLRPYDMEVEGGKKRSGVSVKQNEVKLKSHYYDGEKSLHGYPEVDDSLKDKTGYWKMYFSEVDEFLVDEIKKMEWAGAPKEVEMSIDEAIPDDKNDLPF